MIRGLIGRVGDIMLPRGCASCRGWIPRIDERDQAPICARCRSRLRIPGWPRCDRCHAPVGRVSEVWNGVKRMGCHACGSWPEALSSARSAFVLAGPGANLVHALKYEGWHELADFMGERVGHVALHHTLVSPVFATREPGTGSPRPLCVTPVPTTSARERARGYNQAALLARGVAKSVGAPLVHMLERVGGRRSQIRLEPGMRRANVRGAFVPTPDIAAAAAGEVILVDDVLTTGATAAEAASVLADHGARSVHLVTFARALPNLGSGLC